ncbi:Methionyl-tRNA formyltransferase [Candidatus Arsenophonus lipoptenae]|uniref:Methionyl-tRNA formyltransferase n=1 Tax=Candidatus Arsenophonus lipoptenae TaxID=634113 RepID=A0A0X9VT59_9GAMM|nr:methionyl-tRNA formyltransferase [Candidatus Arsenophonus lipoptenae]AMA65042.1 Methionyl-tRNA formyltransferase [Candidatus Arsenophonus lipoptenae]
MHNYIKIIFAGTPDFAAQHLKFLLNVKNKYQIVGVLTKSDKPYGRGKKIISNPVKILAKKANIPILQPITMITDDIQNWIKNKKADIMIVVAYGLIIPENILNIFPMGSLNVHGSLLPRWRGAAPIQRSILAGDKEIGITIIKMDTGIDTGDILHQINCPIEIKDTSEILQQKLLKLGPNALLYTLDLLISGKAKQKKQNHNFATYAKKVTKNEALINWALSAKQIERCIRAFNPWPISYFIKNGKLIKIWDAEVINHEINLLPGIILSSDKTGIKVSTGKGILNILKIQEANKRILSVCDFINNNHKYFTVGKQIS